MSIKGVLKLNIKVNPGYISDQVEKSGFYDAYTDELLNLAQEFQEGSPVGASGNLKAGWDVQSSPRKVSYGFEIRSNITNDSQAVINRIAGRAPGSPPPIGNINDPESGLLPWVLAKGLTSNPKKALGIAFAVRHKIAEEGTDRYIARDNWVGIDHKGDRISGGRLEEAEKAIALKLKNFS